MIKTGTIIKGIAGFYYVDVGGHVYECKARGAFKNLKLKPTVGDKVDIELYENDIKSGIVINIHERINHFQRPSVANIEQFVVVSSLADPKPNLLVVDRFIAVAEVHGVDVVICFTKSDLVSEDDITYMNDIYSGTYPVVFLDMTQENAIKDLIPYLDGKKSALAGPSGVGKSTILNALKKRVNAQHDKVETGAVSDKTKRGRHTTRHVELFSMDFGGAVFDTPGFTSFDAPDVPEAQLQELYPDISRYRELCKFKGCRHLNEPDCAVRAAVKSGQIHEKRYISYVSQLKELQEREKKRYL